MVSCRRPGVRYLRLFQFHFGRLCVRVHIHFRFCICVSVSVSSSVFVCLSLSLSRFAHLFLSLLCSRTHHSRAMRSRTSRFPCVLLAHSLLSSLHILPPLIHTHTFLSHHTRTLESLPHVHTCLSFPPLPRSFLSSANALRPRLPSFLSQLNTCAVNCTHAHTRRRQENTS